jgi:hypothetical protein
MDMIGEVNTPLYALLSLELYGGQWSILLSGIFIPQKGARYPLNTSLCRLHSRSACGEKKLLLFYLESNFNSPCR